MINTDAAPRNNNTPASTSIFTWCPPTSDNNTPPTDAAMICGRQIVPLNNPRYVPIFLPDIELVRIVNGRANIAAHAQAISRKEMNSIY